MVAVDSDAVLDLEILVRTIAITDRPAADDVARGRLARRQLPRVRRRRVVREIGQRLVGVRAVFVAERLRLLPRVVQFRGHLDAVLVVPAEPRKGVEERWVQRAAASPALPSAKTK